MVKGPPSLKLNTLSNWTALAVNIAVGFFLTPFIIYHLDRYGYGLWTLVGTLIGYYGLLDFGIGSAVTRYVAYYSRSDQQASTNLIIGTAMQFFLGIGFLAIMIAFALANPIAAFFEVDPAKSDPFRYVIWIMGISTGLSFPATVLECTIVGYEKYVLNNAVKIAVTLLKVVLVVVFLNIGLGLIGLALSILIVSIVRLLSSYAVCKISIPLFHCPITIRKPHIIKDLFGYGGISFVIMIALIVRSSIPNLLVGKLIGIESVAILGVTVLLINHFRSFLTSGLGVLQPRFASLFGQQQTDQIRALFLRSITISAVLAVGLGTMILIFGARFILLWVGADFKNSIPILWVLTLGNMFSLSHSPGVKYLYAVKKHAAYAIIVIIEVLLNLILSLLLLRYWGLMGIAVAVALPLLGSSVAQVIYTGRDIKIPMSQYIRCVSPIWLCGALLFAVAYISGITSRFEDKSYFDITVHTIICILVYTLLIFMACPVVRGIVLNAVARLYGLFTFKSHKLHSKSCSNND